MMNVARRDRRQAGAALLVVLLLVATLSFLALAIVDEVSASARRSIATADRSELVWRAIALEALIAIALQESARQNEGKTTADDPVMEKRIDTPVPDGAAAFYIRDRTACFNLNSLVRESDNSLQVNEDAAAEFDELLRVSGRDKAIDSHGLAATIADWIDSDGLQAPGGGEDGYYTALPTPYRTGSTLLADVTELRAMQGVSREALQALTPLVCAHPVAEPSPINVNMLKVDDAPLLVGLLRGRIGLAAARDVIASRPPGGYASVNDFWGHEAFAGLEIAQDLRTRATLHSRYMEAHLDLALRGARLRGVTSFRVDEGGGATVLFRRFGSDL
jgi:general secretion pathway protein K